MVSGKQANSLMSIPIAYNGETMERDILAGTKVQYENIVANYWLLAQIASMNISHGTAII